MSLLQLGMIKQQMHRMQILPVLITCLCIGMFGWCCRMQVLGCVPSLRELDFVAVSKLDRDTVDVYTKAQHGRHK